ncbi:hypothetical protein IBE48_00010 [Francisella philomiragia]|uniref:Uncharacterized protein n=1 Tax=Francisella philomiragia TaxID=28110 RepID=A0AAW3DBW9_9GAMM|nr:hypothetical protein [Francisella philomiragia]KFJ42885.1 hypothetical protein DR78_2 [Francisella philomiragia]MBK2254328.1 hypothetical protein [Francisella philomiragia]MBK2272641.1 hypothetical protein [Francisella philomiragia]MBK2276482.1 hypothetical protein [Francisella philomiragia]MBK2280429.1 hypothetical protein [Francisella philomiragia]
MKYIIFIFSIFICCLATAQQINLSVSTNGNYAVSVDGSGEAYLWNLKSKSVKDLGNNYTLSTYFIPNSYNYLLQNVKTKEVTVTNVNGKIIKKFTPDFVAREQAINKDLTIWVGSIPWGDIYRYSIPDMKKKQIYISWYMAKNDFNKYWRGNPPDGKVPSGTAMGSYFNFNFLDNTLIATPNNSLVVYDFDNHKWYKVNKNVNQTMSTIDPNDGFVYTADDRAMGVKYNLDTQKAIEFTDNTANPANYRLDYLDKSIEPIPYFIKNRKPIGKLSNFKFIDKNRIVGTLKGTTQPFLWLGLYDCNIKQKAIGKDYHFATMPLLKYIPLISTPMDYITGNYNIEPRPNVDGYNTTFDTSVEAHKLVIGQANGNGIMVYNYNPSDETLKLDWVGEPPKVEEKKEEKSKGWFW